MTPKQGGGRSAKKAAGRREIGRKSSREVGDRAKKAGRREGSSREEGDGPKKAGRWETRTPCHGPLSYIGECLNIFSFVDRSHFEG